MIDASTCFILNMTVNGSGVSMLAICRKAGCRFDVTPAGGEIIRS